MDVSLLIGAGGLTVAVLGYWTNRNAIRREEVHRKEQIETEWAREWAAQRPVVYPVALPDWAYAQEGSRYRTGNARVLPLKNGGRGPALNVRGSVIATGSDATAYERELEAGTIAAGDLLDARLRQPGVQHWGSAKGVLRYSDLAGTEYETHFKGSLNIGNEIVLTVQEPVVVSKT